MAYQFSNIKVKNGDGETIQVIEKDYNQSNVEKAAKGFTQTMGQIIKQDINDCFSLVTYENGILGFSI